MINGHTVVIDSPEKSGEEDYAPIPKPFVLTALSGFTGMDVVAILRNAKKVDSFDISVTGELSKVAPIQYISIHLILRLKGMK